MSMLSDFLHPGRAYKQAQSRMQDYYNQGQGMISPYMQQGQQAYGGLSEAMNNLLNPEQLQNEWIKNYETSPQAQQAMEQAKQSGLNNANAMGLMGSSTALNAMQKGASNISLADRQNYLNDLMQKYMAGAGIGQNIYGTGANMAGQGARNAMNMGDMMGGLDIARSQANSGLIGQGIGLAGNLLGSYLTGGMGTGSFGRGAWST